MANPARIRVSRMCDKARQWAENVNIPTSSTTRVQPPTDAQITVWLDELIETYKDELQQSTAGNLKKTWKPFQMNLTGLFDDIRCLEAYVRYTRLGNNDEDNDFLPSPRFPSPQEIYLAKALFRQIMDIWGLPRSNLWEAATSIVDNFGHRLDVFYACWLLKLTEVQFTR